MTANESTLAWLNSRWYQKILLTCQHTSSWVVTRSRWAKSYTLTTQAIGDCSTFRKARGKIYPLQQTLYLKRTALKGWIWIQKQIVRKDVSLQSSVMENENLQSSLMVEMVLLSHQCQRRRVRSISKKCLSCYRRSNLRRTHEWKLWWICSKTRQIRNVISNSCAMLTKTNCSRAR